MLFRAPDLLVPETPLEMCFTLPEQVSGRPAAEVVCTGSVVRVVPAGPVNLQPALAATITRYRFLRTRAPAP